MTKSRTGNGAPGDNLAPENDRTGGWSTTGTEATASDRVDPAAPLTTDTGTTDDRSDSPTSPSTPQRATNGHERIDSHPAASGADAAELAAEDNEPESPEERAAAAEIAAAAVEGSLTDLLRTLAAEDSTVTPVVAANSTDYRVGGVVFVRLEAERASFRLRREIVSAAIRTGGSSSSPLGPDWVTLRPAHWDRYARDRAVSWWQLARRLAGESAGSKRPARA